MSEAVKIIDNSQGHKHLFTPGEWCMRPYSAQFGLTKEKVKSVGRLENLIMDQYARDCGFEPGDSWVLIVRPSGDCEFTPLAAGDPHWCCEKSNEISAEMSPAKAQTPPYAKYSAASAADLDEDLQKITDRDLDLVGGQLVSAGPFPNVFANHFNNVIKPR